MPYTLTDITSGIVPRPPRVVLVGTEGVGKSTFAAGAPGPIFLPVRGEKGLDWIDSQKFPRIVRFVDLIEAFNTLEKTDHKFSTICIDSLTALEPMIGEYACQQEHCASVAKLGGGYGHQEAVLVKYTSIILDWLDYLRERRGMGCVLIAHVKPNPKTFNDPECEPYDTYKVELRESIGAAIYRWSDAMLFATMKKYTRVVSGEGEKKKVVHASGAGERVMYTERRPAFPAKCRFKIPFELPLSYPAFHAEFLRAAQGQ